jgi:hypothetical protein
MPRPKIEVIRGPSSSIYGNNAFFGVINVITKQTKNIGSPEVSGELFLFDSTYDAYKVRGSYGHTFEKGPEVVVSASGYNSKGQRLYFKEFDNPPDTDGWVKGGDYDNNFSFFSKVAYQDLGFHAGFISREKGVPTGAWGTIFGDKRTSTVDDRGFLDLDYKHNFEKQISLQARLYYDHYKYRGYYVYDYEDPINYPDPVVNKDTDCGEWLGGEVQATKTLYEKHKITIGAEIQDHFRQDMRFEDPYEVFLDDKRTSTIFATYAQGEFRPIKDLLCFAVALIALHPQLKIFQCKFVAHVDDDPLMDSSRYGEVYRGCDGTSLEFFSYECIYEGSRNSIWDYLGRVCPFDGPDAYKIQLFNPFTYSAEQTCQMFLTYLPFLWPERLLGSGKQRPAGMAA